MCDLDELFAQEEISDETAYHLANFAMAFALKVEARYFGQIRRYSEMNSAYESPAFLQEKSQIIC